MSDEYWWVCLRCGRELTVRPEPCVCGRSNATTTQTFSALKPAYVPTHQRVSADTPADIRDDAFEAGRLFGICEERGRILDLLDEHSAREYQGGWVRRLREVVSSPSGSATNSGPPERRP